LNVEPVALLQQGFKSRTGFVRWWDNADNPLASASLAEAKLRAIAEAAELVRWGG